MRSPKKLGVWIVVAALVAVSVSLPALAGRAADVRKEAFDLLNQGVTAYKNGDYAIAVEKLRRSAAIALNSFRAYFYLGLALIADRRYADAVDALTIALDLDPNHLQSLVAQGDAYLKLGDLGEANAAFYRALKLQPEYPPALDGLARVYESRGKDEPAIEHYRRAIDANRGFAPAYTHLGDLYLRLNRVEDAVQLLEEAVAVRPDFAGGLNRLALAYGRLGLSNQAIATVQKAMELEPKNPEHAATLGHLQLQQGSLGAAEKSFGAALDLDAGQPEALRGLAEVARRRGEYEEALEWIDTALEDPRLDALRAKHLREYRVAVAAEREAVSDLLDRIAADRAGSEEYARLALIYAGRGRWEQALEYQSRVDPGREQRERLAYMLFRANRFRQAHEIYADLSTEARTATYALNDGVTLAMLGDDRQAIDSYREALELDPDNLTARLFLGNALLRLGQRTEAVAAYKDYLDGGGAGERAERVRRILAQIAPETLPERQLPLQAPSPGEGPPESGGGDEP